MRRFFTSLMWGLIVLILASPARAVHSRDKQSRLVVHQETGEVNTESPAGNVIDTKKLGEKMTYEVDPGESLAVMIVDPNLLLYTYSFKQIEATPTANFTALSEFVSSFKTLAGLLKGLAPIAAPLALGQEAVSLPTALSEVLTSEEKLKLVGYAEALDDLALYLTLIPDLIAKSAESFASAEKIKSDASTWKPDLLSRLDAGIRAVDDIETRLAKQKVEEVPASVLLAKDQEPRISESITKLKAYLDAAKAIHVPITFEPAIQFDATKDGGGTLEIGTAKGSEQAVAKATAKGKPGKYNFAVFPYSPADFSVGPALIYSFIETEDFGTKTENGKITIVRKDSGNQLNGLTVGAMLSITPRIWSNPAFRRSIQVGASPVKDKIGLFLGGSVQFFNQLSIGGGLAYQQAERLAKNLTLGQEIGSEDKLKTNIVFKPGFYLTITLEFGGKK
jgi:hypothetical protein